ncbi:GAF domain-containing protein [Persicobacter psychrovividus]|uniref:GAF domain-containing protein n=1 Tax=Persicobacter psychrovividus TaxID=387638 RepID=A0ABM7VFZ3_9BACT|nr:hypothetical protein PEPS_21730 [Persicobacter psychrovividus]
MNLNQLLWGNHEVSEAEKLKLVALKFIAGLLIVFDLIMLYQTKGTDLILLPVIHLLAICLTTGLGAMKLYDVSKNIATAATVAYFLAIAFIDMKMYSINGPILMSLIFCITLSFVVYGIDQYKKMAAYLVIITIGGLIAYYTDPFIDLPTPLYGTPDQKIHIVFALYLLLTLNFCLFIVDYNGFHQINKSKELNDEMKAANALVITKQEETQAYIKEIEQVREKENEQKWVVEGVSRIDNTLRQETEDSQHRDDILKEIMKYSKLSQGALYLLADDKDDDILELVATYAYGRKKFVKDFIEPGIGILGQVFYEEEPLYMDEIPEDYINISSGLGKARPNYIYLIPLKYNMEVIGVMEFAGFGVLKDKVIEYLNKISESLGAHIANRKVALRTQFLLEQAQQQAEQLRAQEEEIRQNMEEQQAVNEQAERDKEIYMNQIAELKSELKKRSKQEAETA